LLNALDKTFVLLLAFFSAKTSRWSGDLAGVAERFSALFAAADGRYAGVIDAT